RLISTVVKIKSLDGDLRCTCGRRPSALDFEFRRRGRCWCGHYSSEPLARQNSYQDVYAEDESYEHKRRSPGLRVPFVVRRESVIVNLHGQRSDWPVKATGKESAAEGREQERRGFSRHSSHRQHRARRYSRSSRWNH